MAFKNTKANTRQSLLDYFVSGKAVQYHSVEQGYRYRSEGMVATGGLISDYVVGNDVYRAHIFKSSGDFTVVSTGTLGGDIEYVVVGGGGGGGGYGGGGAGGYRSSVTGESTGGGGSLESAIQLAVGPYTVTIGGGGSGSTPNGTDGTNTVFGPITSLGGGYGGQYNAQGGDGGSGGGTGDYPRGGRVGPAIGYPGPTAQGYPGGQGWSDQTNYTSGSGGGGAGAQGGGAPEASIPYSDRLDYTGDGGNGIRTLIAGATTTSTGLVGTPGPASAGGTGGAPSTAVTGGWLAGGGGGLSGPFVGGAGGGASSPDGDGLENTGGGGGSQLGSGGSGIVIVRYKITEVSGQAKASGGVVSFYNNKTIHTFYSTDTFVAPATFNETIEYVVVGGGGSGGGTSFRGGGGGAGTYLHNTVNISGPSTTNVQIGGGGSYVNPNGPGGNGTPSFFGPPITAPGGGMGGGYSPPYAGIPGGSGGGAGGYPGGAAGLAGTDPGPATGAPFPGNSDDMSPPAGWGYRGGGRGDNGLQQGGGGGGAGGQGVPSNRSDYPGTYGLGGPGIQLPTTFRNPAAAPSGTGGTSPQQPGASGGLGYQSPTGTNWYVAGGGNGGGYSKDYGDASSSGVNVQVETFVPAGGGGAGAVNAPGNNPEPQHPFRVTGHPGEVNSGSGGGGSSPQYDSVGPGQGGSGIVMVAYPT